MDFCGEYIYRKMLLSESLAKIYFFSILFSCVRITNTVSRKNEWRTQTRRKQSVPFGFSFLDNSEQKSKDCVLYEYSSEAFCDCTFCPPLLDHSARQPGLDGIELSQCVHLLRKLMRRDGFAIRHGTEVSRYMSCEIANWCGRREVSPDVVTNEDEDKILFHTVGFGMCGFGFRRRV